MLYRPSPVQVTQLLLDLALLPLPCLDCWLFLLLPPGMVPNAEFVQQVKQHFPNQDHPMVVVSACVMQQLLQGCKPWCAAAMLAAWLSAPAVGWYVLPIL